jgi:Pyruvate/2-oxoacid:ferredoxin oxidoreductase delta subunit
MKIDFQLCINCGDCRIICPAGAIVEDSDRDVSVINSDHCFECGLCRRISVCPQQAILETKETKEFPRVLRALFSDPSTVHKHTSIPGRGTEESKTNDVTGRVKRGEFGICIEFGRPSVGCRFKDIEPMTAYLVQLNVTFEPMNPLYNLMEKNSGRFSDEIRPQRILSAILEIRVRADQFEKVTKGIIQTGKTLETVFSLSVISRFDKNGDLPLLSRLKKIGLNPYPHAKVNLGMGRPLVKD